MTASPLTDPHWFPHTLDAHGVTLVRTMPERLRAASFLDGREAFGEEATGVSYAAFAAAARDWPATPLPMLFHVSFCGSTLLSRMLDVPGHTIVYREPAIHVALADRASAGLPFADLLAQTDKAFARPVGQARAIVKPTSWANAMLPIWAATRTIAPVFVVMTPAMFLRAVFRGGRDRIGFTMRLASHLSRVVAAAPAWLDAAVHEGGDPMDVAARVTLIALSAELDLMREARHTLGLGADVVIDAATIFSDPHGAAERVAATFALDGIAAEAAGRHAKSPANAFSAAGESAANHATEAHHAARFDAAVRWAERTGLRFDA